jgi:hypothetical protein
VCFTPMSSRAYSDPCTAGKENGWDCALEMRMAARITSMAVDSEDMLMWCAASSSSGSDPSQMKVMTFRMPFSRAEIQ